MEGAGGHRSSWAIRGKRDSREAIRSALRYPKHRARFLKLQTSKKTTHLCPPLVCGLERAVPVIGGSESLVPAQWHQHHLEAR